ncbi:hypothetical protein [Actinoplanes xinjiangensis]|uniref:hypothetical protein n=1 Tax=Actinoplanes xinjiangensis TaxID=512350 RepID=UPI00342C9107
MTATAVGAASPAFGAAVFPVSWSASYAGAQVAGTTTHVQHPLGVSRTTTVKGVIKGGTATGCFQAVINTGSTSWTSPQTCVGSAAESFVTTFQSFTISPPATVRLCSAGSTSACGTPSPLW